MNDNELRALIDKYVRLRVHQHKDVMKATGIAHTTYYRKLANPQEFRLGELRAIFDYLKIPTSERVI